MKATSSSVYLLLVLTIIISSCKTNELSLSGTNELTFGHFYGECFGEDCKVIYKLADNKLLQDTKHLYPGSEAFYNGDYIELSNEKYKLTKDLIDFFPMDLLNEKSTVIGQPDAGDWGGLYIEYNFNGVHKFWLIDQMKSNVPEKYHNFIDKANEKIQTLLSPVILK